MLSVPVVDSPDKTANSSKDDNKASNSLISHAANENNSEASKYLMVNSHFQSQAKDLVDEFSDIPDNLFGQTSNDSPGQTSEYTLGQTSNDEFAETCDDITEKSADNLSVPNYD